MFLITLLLERGAFLQTDDEYSGRIKEDYWEHFKNDVPLLIVVVGI